MLIMFITEEWMDIWSMATNPFCHFVCCTCQGPQSDQAECENCSLLLLLINATSESMKGVAVPNIDTGKGFLKIYTEIHSIRLTKISK